MTKSIKGRFKGDWSDMGDILTIDGYDLNISVDIEHLLVSATIVHNDKVDQFRLNDVADSWHQYPWGYGINAKDVANIHEIIEVLGAPKLPEIKVYLPKSVLTTD